METATFLLEVEWGKLILLTGGTLIITFVVIGGGAYLFLRVFASLLNSRRDSWESSAQDLGLQVDRNAGTIYKPFTGMRKGKSVTVSHYAVMRDEDSADDHVEVKTSLAFALPFSFAIEKPEMFYQKVVAFFSPNDDDIGHEIFDKRFKVECSDVGDFNALLNVELSGGDSPTLLTDLLLAAKRFHRVKIDDSSVKLGFRADFSDSASIEPVIEKAIYLAERIEAAGKKIGREK